MNFVRLSFSTRVNTDRYGTILMTSQKRTGSQLSLLHGQTGGWTEAEATLNALAS